MKMFMMLVTILFAMAVKCLSYVWWCFFAFMGIKQHQSMYTGELLHWDNDADFTSCVKNTQAILQMT